jgi:hypothetical protein
LQERPNENISNRQTVASEVSTHLQVRVQVFHALQELFFSMVRHQFTVNVFQPLIDLNAGWTISFK